MATGKIDASIRIWIKESKRIVVLTGAGISTESGIPDFRGPQGVWTKDPEAEKLSDIHYYVADPEVRKKSWQSRLAHPACKDCGGILKSDTISFGQALAPEMIERAMRAAAEADLLLSVGTSLKVYPIASAVPAAKQAGARLVIVNAQPTPFDGIADAVLRSAIGETLPRIVEMRDEARL